MEVKDVRSRIDPHQRTEAAIRHGGTRKATRCHTLAMWAVAITALRSHAKQNGKVVLTFEAYQLVQRGAMRLPSVTSVSGKPWRCA
jgi:hypothetical protein